MTPILRIVLVLMSLLLLVVMLGRIRNAKARIEDSMFWVFFALMLVLFSIFPDIAYFLSGLVGTMSTSNFIFMLIIFLLLVKSFSMSLRISQLETKVNDLVQRIALDNNQMEKERKEEKEVTKE